MDRDGEERAALRVSWAWIGGAAAVLLALWLLDLFVLRTNLLSHLKGAPALTPLYAFWKLNVRPSAAVFPLVAAGCVWLAPRLADPARTSAARFALLLPVLALLLAGALFSVREAPSALGSQFNVYLNEEFWHDALRFGDVRWFLAHYVEVMPHLSTHGRHFPPGNAVLLHGVIQVAGPRELAAGIVVLAFAAAALPLVWLGLRQIASEPAARQGALLAAAAPTFLDHACIAMDAVFLFFAALAWWLALRAFASPGRTIAALLAGLALSLATCFSFSTFPLGMALSIYALLHLGRQAWKPLALVGAAYAAGLLLVWLAADLALWDCLRAGNEHAQAFMDRVRAARPRTDRARIGYGNAVAFAIGVGAPLVAACAARLWRDGLRGPRWKLAALLALCVMAFAPLHYLETERIWLYALPWVAGIALCDGPLDAGSLRRLLGASLLQAFAMECLLLTLW